MADVLLIERDTSLAAKLALAFWSVAAVASAASVTLPVAASGLQIAAVMTGGLGALCMTMSLVAVAGARNILDPVMFEIGLKDESWYPNTPEGRAAARQDRYQDMKPPSDDDDDPSRKRVRISDLDTPDVAWVSVRDVAELFIEVDRCLIVLSEVERHVVVLVSGKNVTVGYPASSRHRVEIFEQNGPVGRVEI